MIRLIAFACGLLCGAGFFLSGLYDPALVRNVHDREDGPIAFSLALFAIVFVAALIPSVFRTRSSPLMGGKEEPLPNYKARKPLISAVFFGVGWGLTGYFPLAALVSAGALSPGAAVFLLAVLIGMVLVDVVTGSGKSRGGRKGSFG